MCGIAGYYGKGNAATARRMIGAIRHRGPDDMGVAVEGEAGLAHARLSVIDTSSGGHQPMYSGDGKAVIVFNGEIYNFKELKDDPLLSEVQWKSTSDTEVIAELYRACGTDAFARLRGMYAFALLDIERGELFLVRDRIGKKPLYYTMAKGTLLFASEMRALREHPSFTPELDYSSLAKFLMHEYVPTPHSILTGVFKVPPSSFVRFARGTLQVQAFAHLSFEQKRWNKGEALVKLDTLLRDSVRDRLISDVPLGVFLSGGIDSSTVAYYAQQEKEGGVDTFSIGFSDKRYDESSHAREVARALGTRHHEEMVSEKEALDAVAEVLAAQDEPLADDSMLPTYLLARFARTSVTVALGGDGGDELFFGYPTFQAARLAEWWGKVPAPVRRAAARHAHHFGSSSGYLTPGYKFAKFAEGFEGNSDFRHQRWLRSFGEDDLYVLFAPRYRAALENVPFFEDADRYMKEAKRASQETRAAFAYLRTYLMDGVMVKVDRMTMRHALEARSPLLDDRIVEFAFSLPDDLKLRGMTTKYLLKELMRDRLPEGIAHRSKRGFALPVAGWLRGPLREWCDGVLSEDSIGKTGLFSYEEVRRLKEEHFSGARNHRQKLWTLLSFQIWWNEWFG